MALRAILCAVGGGDADRVAVESVSAYGAAVLGHVNAGGELVEERSLPAFWDGPRRHYSRSSGAKDSISFLMPVSPLKAIVSS